MTVQQDELEEEIEDLCSEIDDIYVEACDVAEEAGDYSGKLKGENIDWPRINPVIQQYTVWYHSAEVMLTEYLPKREAEFEQYYENISGLLHFDHTEYKKVDQYQGALARFVMKQTNLLQSIGSVESLDGVKIGR